MPSVVSFLSRWSPRLANKGFSKGLRAYQSGYYAAAFALLEPLAKNGHAESRCFSDASMGAARVLL